MTVGRMWVVVALFGVALLASLTLSGLKLSRHSVGHTRIQPLELPEPMIAETSKLPRDLSSITELELFGQAIKQDLPTDTRSPRASLNFTLHGVLIDSDPTRSRALIRSGGAIAVYQLGDKINASELIAIESDTITVLLGSEQFVVGFDGAQDDLERSRSISEKLTQSKDPKDPFVRMAAAIVPGQGSIDLRDPPPPQTTDDYIALWRERITRNPQAAMDRVGVELVENGYRVKENPNIGVTLAGLRPDDVITKLNGQSVGDTEQDLILYDDVAAAGTARIEVIRDGQSMMFTFPLK